MTSSHDAHTTDRLLQRYLDDLAADPHADPPAALSASDVALARALLQTQRGAPLDPAQRVRIWMQTLRAAEQQRTSATMTPHTLTPSRNGRADHVDSKETETMTLHTRSWPRQVHDSQTQAQRGLGTLLLVAAAVILVVVGLLVLRGSADDAHPLYPAGVPGDDGASGASQQGTVTPLPALQEILSELVTVNGGTFTMGTTLEEAIQAMDDCALYGRTCEEVTWVSDSIPPHTVSLDTFQIETTEATVAQYIAFLNALGPDSHQTACGMAPCVITTQEDPNSSIAYDGRRYDLSNPLLAYHPATFVTWHGADAYCAAVGRRLPTEAEWERAARGSNNYVYPWGFQFDMSRANSALDPNPGTASVYAYPSGQSMYGVLGMAGNVSEWVSDWYASDWYAQAAASQRNPAGPFSGTEKVLRGGAWDTYPLFLRSVHRMSADPGLGWAAAGFRCAADMPVVPPVTPENSQTATAEAVRLEVEQTIGAVQFTSEPGASTHTPTSTATPSVTPTATAIPMLMRTERPAALTATQITFNATQTVAALTLTVTATPILPPAEATATQLVQEATQTVVAQGIQTAVAQTVEAHADVQSAVMGPNGTLVTVTPPLSVMPSVTPTMTPQRSSALDAESLRMLITFHAPDALIVWSPPGSIYGPQLAVAGGYSIAVYDVSDLRTDDPTSLSTKWVLTALNQVYITALVFSPDGAVLFTGHEDGVLRVWSMADGTLLAERSVTNNAAITSLDFSPDGTLLVIGVGSETQFWTWS